MRKTLFAAIGVASLIAVLSPAIAEESLVDPPGEPRRLSQELTGHSRVSDFEISPDGMWVRYGTDGAIAGQWIVSIPGGAPRALDGDTRCYSCFWVPESALLVVDYFATGEFGVVDASTGGELVRVAGRALAATADGARLIAESGDAIVSMDPRNPADIVELVGADEFEVIQDFSQPHVVAGPLPLRKRLTEVVDGVETWVGEELWVIEPSGGTAVRLLGGPGRRIGRAFPSPGGGSIAVIYDTANGKRHVGWRTLTGRKILDATFEELRVRDVVFSPDSRRLIVPHGLTMLSVMSRPDRDVALLTDELAFYFAVMPDSSGVLFTHVRPQGNHVYEDISAFIYRVDMDGSGLEQLTWNLEDRDDRTHKVIAFAPNKRWVVFLDFTNYDAVLSRMPITGGEREQLSDHETESYFGRATLTADRTRILYVGGESSPKYVLSVPVRPGTVVNLTPDNFGTNMGAFAVTPDSQRVVFISRYVETTHELWVVDVGHRCGGSFATLVGSPGDDVISGTPGPDVIAGLEGDDVLRGRQSRDVICGGPGNDVIAGNNGADTLYGDDGNDTLWGGHGADVLTGGPGGDSLGGGPGFDVCYTDTLDIRVAACEDVYAVDADG